jgi:hypothetical protein
MDLTAARAPESVLSLQRLEGGRSQAENSLDRSSRFRTTDQDAANNFAHLRGR